MDNQFNIPILLLIFNRPDVTQVMFDSIKKIKPRYLYVAADGFREDKIGEAELCKKTKSVIVENIDWECEVKTLFRDKNLGLRRAITEAIDWFFENEEQGIILEDDIVGSSAFFKFCESNLERYKDDSRVMLISGFNHLGEWKPDVADYFFSRIGAIWGWATWKRAWKKNKRDIADWEEAKKKGVLNDLFPNDDMLKFRKRVFERTFTGEVNSWAFIWTFYRLVNSGLSILPSKNLITNIGFGEDATHTSKSNKKIESIKCYNPNYNPIKHPTFIYADPNYDLDVFNVFHKSESYYRYIIKRINRKSKYLKKRLSQSFS